MEPQAEQGGLNDTVGFQFCELIIAGFFQLPAYSYSRIYFIDASKLLPHDGCKSLSKCVAKTL